MKRMKKVKITARGAAECAERPSAGLAAASGGRPG